jgi:hypothetical protein
VAKLIAVRTPEEIQRQAQDYVKSYILFPSGLVGLICLVGGVGGLGYQLMSADTYTWATFYQSSGLLLLGGVLGLVHTRYQQFLLRAFPNVLAARMRAASMKQGKKRKGNATPPPIEHPGRAFVPVAYAIGGAVLVGTALAASLYGQVNLLAALLMPWAGFHWARLFFWRKVVS